MHGKYDYTTFSVAVLMTYSTYTVSLPVEHWQRTIQYVSIPLCIYDTNSNNFRRELFAVACLDRDTFSLFVVFAALWALLWQSV